MAIACDCQIGLKHISQEGMHTWYYSTVKLIKKKMAGPREIFTIVVWLNWHRIKPHFKYLFILLNTCFSHPWSEKSTFPVYDYEFRDSWMFMVLKINDGWMLSLKMASLLPFCLTLGKICGRKSRKNVKIRRWRGFEVLTSEHSITFSQHGTAIENKIS